MGWIPDQKMDCRTKSSSVCETFCRRMKSKPPLGQLMMGLLLIGLLLMGLLLMGLLLMGQLLMGQLLML